MHNLSFSLSLARTHAPTSSWFLVLQLLAKQDLVSAPSDPTPSPSSHTNPQQSSESFPFQTFFALGSNNWKHDGHKIYFSVISNHLLCCISAKRFFVVCFLAEWMKPLVTAPLSILPVVWCTWIDDVEFRPSANHCPPQSPTTVLTAPHAFTTSRSTSTPHLFLFKPFDHPPQKKKNSLYIFCVTWIFFFESNKGKWNSRVQVAGHLQEECFHSERGTTFLLFLCFFSFFCFPPSSPSSPPLANMARCDMTSVSYLGSVLPL